MIKVLECIEWKAPNRPGEMSRFVEHFKKSGVSLDGLWNCGSGGGYIGAAGKQPAKLRAALKAIGVKASPSKCFLVAGKDKAGALVGVLAALGKAKINVECSTAAAAQGKFGALIWVKDRDLAKARRVLKA